MAKRFPDAAVLLDGVLPEAGIAGGHRGLGQPAVIGAADDYVVLVVDRASGEVDAYGVLDSDAASDEAQRLREDVANGLLTNVSVGVVRLQSFPT